MILIAVGDVADRAKYLIGLITPPSGHSPETARAELSRLSLPYTANAFVQAARQSDMHAVKLFLVAGMDPNAEDDEHNATALYEAVAAGRTEIAQALVAAQARVSSWDLSHAAGMGKPDMLRVLLVHSADPEAISGAFVAAASLGYRENYAFYWIRGRAKPCS